ncbi:hypothetical protein PR048_022297 [Dryococelus australis]|uniref:J domain-containing protein n=1 Tax=Dryococelus australis TaxID=614101 RepID=A0ABQ9H0W2_9NEOP|nr:hypothetical protein PR048_022297 [Dryococelus australis]
MASMLTLFRPNPWIPFLQIAKLLSVSSQHSKSLYDSLGLTPKATQAEIKTAYYKLSKIYHPDRNEGCEEAATKFRDITEAYEVLGNLGLRKRYDRGIFRRSGEGTGSTVSDDTDETYSKFYESRMQRSRPPTVGGKTPIYDFDEWAQAHYGASFARKQAAKQEYASQVDQQLRKKRMQRNEMFSYCVFIMLVAVFFGAYPWNDYDVVQTVKSSPSREKSNVFPEDK